MTAPTKVFQPRKARFWRGTAFVIVVLLVAIVSCVVLISARVGALSSHAQSASDSAHAFIEALSKNPDDAQQHLDKAREDLELARETLHGIPIQQMQAIPWVQHNVEASDTLIVNMQKVLDEAAPVMMSLSGVVDFTSGTLKSNPDFSGLDPSVIQDARHAADVIKSAREAIHGIDTAGLLADVDRAVMDARTMLDDVYRKIAPLESMAEDFKKYLPPNLASQLDKFKKMFGG